MVIRLRISSKGTVNPKFAVAVLRYPSYYSLGFNRVKVIHQHTGFLGFESLKTGIDYSHDIGNSLLVSTSIDVFRSMNYKVFEIESTGLEAFIQIGF